MEKRRTPGWLMLVYVVSIIIAGTRNGRAQTSTGSITFEEGIDGTKISSTIPGLRFSNTQGFEWVYGDVRTGTYNAPYPNDCPRYGSTCIYTVAGNFFAWMGAVQGTGRIDFTQGTGTRFSAQFSTAETLTLNAYSRTDELVASAQISPNTSTGRLDKANLLAPSGKLIAYVLISGSQNRWLMDNVETDAPGVPSQPPTSFPKPKAVPKKASQPTVISVVQQARPNVAVQPGGILTYTIVAANRGHNPAKQTTIHMPFDPALVQLIDVNFSRPSAWVSDVQTNTLAIQTGLLGSGGDIVTATLRFIVRDDAAQNTRLDGRLTYSWRDATGTSTQYSNVLLLTVAAQEHNDDTVAMTITPAIGEAGKTHILSVDVFAPDEPVALWYNALDGRAIAITTTNADNNGHISLAFTTTNFATGSYTIIAHGTWTDISARGTLHVE